MKKITLILSIILFSANIVLANNPVYDAELSKIRTIKNAKVSALNKQIKDISTKITELELNTTITELEKEKKINTYTKELDQLTTKKYQISEQYKKDKAILKKKYK